MQYSGFPLVDEHATAATQWVVGVSPTPSPTPSPTQGPILRPSSYRGRGRGRRCGPTVVGGSPRSCTTPLARKQRRRHPTCKGVPSRWYRGGVTRLVRAWQRGEESVKQNITGLLLDGSTLHGSPPPRAHHPVDGKKGRQYGPLTGRRLSRSLSATPSGMRFLLTVCFMWKKQTTLASTNLTIVSRLSVTIL